MFNRIKSFFGPADTPPHEIVQCETKALDTPGGPKFVILLAANLHKPEALDSLVEALVERFKVQRMVSPPDTSMLLITIIGPCGAPEAVSRWRDRVASDPVAQVWMNLMEKADLAIGPAQGAVVPQYHSLLTSTASTGEDRL